jgi:hypothetical protein
MKKTLIGVLVVVAIGVAAGLHNLYRAARVKSAQPCWIKLVNIDAAKDHWGLDTHATSGAPVTLSNILPYLSGAPTCHVTGATYVIGKVGEEPRCTTHGTISHFKPDHY